MEHGTKQERSVRRTHLLASLLLATLALTASAEVLDLGIFKPVKPRPESGITDYHYWKDGRTILVEALQEGEHFACLELSWPGNMTVYVRCTTSSRDVTLKMLMEEGKFEFEDHGNRKTVELRFDASRRTWQALGTNGSAEEFAASEKKLLQIIGDSYDDALANLNLGPLGQRLSALSPDPYKYLQGPHTTATTYLSVSEADHFTDSIARQCSL